MQLKVFISSRLKELEEERTAVEEAASELWNSENLPFTIWRWESAREIPSGKHPDKVQSKGVRDSDIYVLILGSEYGDFEYGESPTHKEYDIACSKLEEDCILIYIKKVERKREENLEKWIEVIKNKHTFKSFENSDQLKDLVKTRLRDLWNKERWKVNIPTIKSTLRKEETTEGDFFKKEPEWIDFEEGFVVERKEVDEIIRNLEKDNIQLVLGEPASGKSTILKNIGFKLAKEDKDVYIVEFKKHSGDEVKRYFDDIPEINDEKAVFIVDDAHLLPTKCERLVREFKNRKLKTKLIIGSRETREIPGEHPKEALEFEYLSKIGIHAEDVTEEMIKSFLKKEYHFSDERIKTVSKNLEKYKKDLWHLSWALKAYNPEKDSVEGEEIYQKIRDSIRNISVGEGKPRINAEDIFLPLSIFYRFEIPVERRIIEEQIGVEENIIKQLIDLFEIIETEGIGKRRTLSLKHSSIADLYFKTYQSYPDLGEKVKKIFQGDGGDMEYRMFYQYINSAPANSLDVLIHLKGDWLDAKQGKTLLEKLIECKEIEKSIENGIEKEEDIEKIGHCMVDIAVVSKDVGLKLADRIDIGILASKIEKEVDIWNIASCVNYFAFASKEAGLKLANRIDINVLASKIEKEEDIGNIEPCMRDIIEVSEEVALKLVDAVSSIIEKEEDFRDGLSNIERIGLCVHQIVKASEKVGLKLIDTASIRLEKEEDIGKIGRRMMIIAEIGGEVGLTNRINIDILASKIEKEEDIGKIGPCMSEIIEVSEEVALTLVDAIASRIEKEEDIEKIGRCVQDIYAFNNPKASKKVRSKLAARIFDVVSLKMKKEEDIGKITYCMKCIEWASEKVGLNLANRIFDVLFPKIEKEEDIGKIGVCVEFIARVNEEAGLKLAKHIDIDILTSKIEKEEDIENIGCCMGGIDRASEKVGLKLTDRIFDVVSLKMEKEEDIEKIGRCVGYIGLAGERGERIALKFANHINIKVLASKIEKEEDIEKIGRCLRDIAGASEKVGLKLANRIDIDILSSKIEKKRDIKKIEWCVRHIAEVSEEVALEIINHLNSAIREKLQKGEVLK